MALNLGEFANSHRVLDEKNYKSPSQNGLALHINFVSWTCFGLGFRRTNGYRPNRVPRFPGFAAYHDPLQLACSRGILPRTHTRCLSVYLVKCMRLRQPGG